MPHMPTNSCVYMRQLCQHLPHMSSMQSTMSAQAVAYINFTSLTYTPKQIFLQHCICVSYHTSTVVYIQTAQYCIYK